MESITCTRFQKQQQPVTNQSKYRTRQGPESLGPFSGIQSRMKTPSKGAPRAIASNGSTTWGWSWPSSINMSPVRLTSQKMRRRPGRKAEAAAQSHEVVDHQHGAADSAGLGFLVLE